MCRRQVADLAETAGAFEEKNARLVIIGNGEPRQIAPFKKAVRYNGEVFTDPSLELYKTLDFKRNVGSLFGIKSFAEGIRSVGTGHFMKGIQGDTLQQGGAVIIGPGNVIHYYYANKEAGDHPPVRDMLAACDPDTPPD